MVEIFVNLDGPADLRAAETVVLIEIDRSPTVQSSHKRQRCRCFEMPEPSGKPKSASEGMGTRVPWRLEKTTQFNLNQQPRAALAQTDKTSELRCQPKLTGVASGVKGQDERQSTVPLTPLSTPAPHHTLDKANVITEALL